MSPSLPSTITLHLSRLVGALSATFSNRLKDRLRQSNSASIDASGNSYSPGRRVWWDGRWIRNLKKKKGSVVCDRSWYSTVRWTMGFLVFEVIRQIKCVLFSSSAMALIEVISIRKHLAHSTKKHLRCGFNLVGIRGSLLRSSAKYIHILLCPLPLASPRATRL